MTRYYVLGDVCELLADGASWSTVVKEGESVEATGSGATVSTIRAITSGLGIRSHQWSSGNLNRENINCSQKCQEKGKAKVTEEQVAHDLLRKYQPLPEVPGKGKAKVTEEQVAHDLLSLQKLKKKSPTDQYIFQRRTFTPTRSSGHDEPSYAELGQPDPGNAGANVQSIPSPVVHAGPARKHMDLDVADVSPQPSTE
nr:hypothetical protein [Tanacetum cinerariifolium]